VLQERVLLHEDGVVKLPSYLTDEEGATLPIAAVTAWQALVISGGLRPGERVLVRGTGGDIDGALHTAANAVTTWPTDDLFPNYGLPLRHQGFSDDPLIAGVTTVKSVHLNELRSRIDWARAKRGLPPYGYSHAISPGTAIKASDITDCRSALAAVYLALSLPAPTYTDVNLAAGMSIKAAHLAELRTAVRAVE
jgi:hypothetical protein